jgi:uncharacterized membrane protein YeaQ/YmgE (transglycosylase-associated protein family)
MSLQAQVFIIIMVVGFVLGGIAALSDKGRGLVTYLVFGVVGSSVGGALLVPLFGIQLITADPIVTTIVHSTFAALIFVVVTREFGRRPTLGELQRTTPCVWLWCERCQHHAPLARCPRPSRNVDVKKRYGLTDWLSTDAQSARGVFSRCRR